MEQVDFETSDSFSVSAECENLPRIQLFVTSFMERNHINQKAISQIDIAVEELYVNIASYAYPKDATEKPFTVECAFSAKNKTLYLLFTDKGKPYNPLTKKDPALGLSPSEMKEGGWGIYMVKQLVDGIEYEYEFSGGCNKLRLKKYI